MRAQNRINNVETFMWYIYIFGFKLFQKFFNFIDNEVHNVNQDILFKGIDIVNLDGFFCRVFQM